MYRILATLVFTLLAIVCQAQTTVSGKLSNSKNEPLFGAAAALLRLPDSTLAAGTTTDIDGNFKLENIANGQYVLKLTYLGYETKLIKQPINGVAINLGNISLQAGSTTLGQVNVVDIITPVQVKNDTTQYNSGAFKTNKDANTEDLVTKMPGITVVDGKVNAQGEEVKKVLVDGKPFFGDDPSSVLKNLPAEVVDKIQVFDKKSDQSQFTGFDDGNSSKTINIITKAQFRNGVFGKVYGGYGYDSKWRGGLTLNMFKGKRRITILGNTNNINEQNFSAEDLLGVMSSTGGGGRGPMGGGGGGMRPPGGGPGGGNRPGGGSNADNFLVDQKGGITTTNAFGLNYSNTWGKLEFTGSYFFNASSNTAVSNTYRTYITQNSNGLNYTENATNQSDNINHRANFRLEWKIDSMNSFVFTPKFTYQKNSGSSTIAGINRNTNTLLSETANNYSSSLWATNFSAPILYRHSFAKKGRTISVNLTPGYNSSRGNSNLLTYTNYIADTLSVDTLNQIANLNKQGFVFNTSVVYTEPIGKSGQLMFNYGNNINMSSSDRQTFNFSDIDNSYSRFDTTLSNTFSTVYHSELAGISYGLQKTKWNLTAGVSYQWAILNNEREFPYAYNLNKTFNSVLPNAMFQYKFNAKKNLRIFYRSSNNAPNVDQLQDVINNSNPLQLSTGNAALKQDFQNSLNVRYSSVNTDKNTAFFVFANSTYTNNYIGKSTYIAAADTLLNNTILLAEGSQLSMPVNLNGYYSMRAFSSYSFPISKIKMNLSFNGGISYTHTPSLINSATNFANNTSASLGIVFSSNISEKIDFTLSSNSAYSNIQNTLQTASNNTYYNQNSRFKIQAQIWKGLFVSTDINHQYYNGLSASLTQNYLLWNAAIGYKFLKDRAAEFRLTAFDILKQNNSISRSITETYFEDVQTNVLQRYFMLTFTYNFKAYKEKKATSK